MHAAPDLIRANSDGRKLVVIAASWLEDRVQTATVSNPRAPVAPMNVGHETARITTVEDRRRMLPTPAFAVWHEPRDAKDCAVQYNAVVLVNTKTGAIARVDPCAIASAVVTGR
jgi:hypothetical protein